VLVASGCFARGELISQRILDDAQRRRQLGIVPTPSATPSPLPASITPTPTRTPPAGRSFATVRRVWDGNTILIDSGYSVRYIGVNTPGAGMFGRPLDPFGRDAAERNVELVEGRQVELEGDATDVDGSGLLLRYVYVNDVMVNEVLLREGLATMAPLGRNTLHQSELRAAETEARARPLNVWTLVTLTPTITLTPTETFTPTTSPTITLTPTPTRPPVAPGGQFAPLPGQAATVTPFVRFPPSPTRP